jgi:hypothetical protein
MKIEEIEKIKEKLEEQRYLNHYHCQLLLAALAEKDKEIERLKEGKNNVEKNAISLLSSSLCDQHSSIVKSMPFWEFYDSRVNKCELCSEQEITRLNKMFSMKQDDWMEVCKENDRLNALIGESRIIIKSIMDDLPQKRDWLDPDIEREARQIIKKIGESTK